MQIVCVDPTRVEEIRHILAPSIERAMRHTHAKVPTEKVLDAIKKGDMQGWVVGEGNIVYAVAVTQVLDYGAHRAVEGVYLYGREAERWVGQLFEMVRSFAKVYNCQTMEMRARPGWGRFLKKCGIRYGTPQVLYVQKV